MIVAVSVFALQNTAYSPELPPPPERCSPSTIGARDYTLYRDLLGQYAPYGSTRTAKTIVITETVQVPDHYWSNAKFSVARFIADMQASRKDVALSENTASNFVRVYDENILLDREQLDELPLVFPNEEELDNVIVDEGGWAAPRVSGKVSEIVRLSRIGFSCDGTQALLYRSETCGAVYCGHGVRFAMKSNGIIGK